MLICKVIRPVICLTARHCNIPFNIWHDESQFHIQQEAAYGSSNLCSLPRTSAILLSFVHCRILYSYSGQSHFSRLKIDEVTIHFSRHILRKYTSDYCQFTAADVSVHSRLLISNYDLYKISSLFSSLTTINFFP